MRSLKDSKMTGKDFISSVFLILCILTNTTPMTSAQDMTTTNPTVTANATSMHIKALFLFDILHAIRAHIPTNRFNLNDY